MQPTRSKTYKVSNFTTWNLCFVKGMKCGTVHHCTASFDMQEQKKDNYNKVIFFLKDKYHEAHPEYWWRINSCSNLLTWKKFRKLIHCFLDIWSWWILICKRSTNKGNCTSRAGLEGNWNHTCNAWFAINQEGTALHGQQQRRCLSSRKYISCDWIFLSLPNTDM